MTQTPPDAEIENYLASLPEDRQATMRRLHAVISAAVPELPVKLWSYSGDLIGYGSYPYRTKAGVTGDWFPIGLANRKAYVSLYAIGYVGDESIIERARTEFPGAKFGVSCINITKPDLVDDAAVTRLVLAAAEWMRAQS